MKYTKYTIETTPSAEDIVSSVVFDNGITGVLIEDKENLSEKDLQEMYVDIPMDNKPDGKARVSFFVNIVTKDQKDKINEIKKNHNDNKDTLDLSYSDNFDNVFLQDEIDEILEKINNELKDYTSFTDMGSLNIIKEELPDIDYLNNWKKFYKPIVLDDVVIKPVFENDEQNNQDVDIDYNNKLVINIEPGQAFGTGSHETTKLCIKAITKVMNNYADDTVDLMDIGCGSGILGILAKKLKAHSVVNVDVDNNIKSNIIDNYKLNDLICDKLYFGNIINDDSFRDNIDLYNKDIIVANIISKVIISLIDLGKVYMFLKPNSYLIVSGILQENVKDVENAIINDNHFDIIDKNSEGEWVCLILKKK